MLSFRRSDHAGFDLPIGRKQRPSERRDLGADLCAAADARLNVQLDSFGIEAIDE